MYIGFYILGLSFVHCAWTSSHLDSPPNSFHNRLRFGYGVNFKFNGLLHNNLDRIWVISRLAIPDYQLYKSVPLPPSNFSCSLDLENNIKLDSRERISHMERICLSSWPMYTHIVNKSRYLRSKIMHLLGNDLQHILPPPVSETQGMDGHTSTSLGPRARRFISSMAAFVPALGKLATIAVEALGDYLSNRRARAVKTALTHMDRESRRNVLKMSQLENEFLVYGDYDVNATLASLDVLTSLHNRASVLESWVSGADPNIMDTYLTRLDGGSLYAHHIQLFLRALEENYVVRYESLIRELEALLRGISTLSRGFLPVELFSPTHLSETSSMALSLLHRHNPDYVLALPHLSDMYNLPLVTFGVEESGRLLVCYPVFVKEFRRDPMELFQVETIMVPIEDIDSSKNSYSRVQITKPYLAVNADYYIELTTSELVSCKRLQSGHFCEELFLVKHKSRHSCSSALFFNLDPDVIKRNCDFEFYSHVNPPPSILDGGQHIVLANMLHPKRLICTQDEHLATPLPTHPYTMVSRDILCNCHLQVDLSYVLKTVSGCSQAQIPKFLYTANSAFMITFQNLLNLTVPISTPILKDFVLPINISTFYEDSTFRNEINCSKQAPETLSELYHLVHLKRQLLANKTKLFSDDKGERNEGNHWLRKGSFLYTTIFHIYVLIGSSISILLILPHILHAIKQHKMKTMLTGLTLYKAVNTAEAIPLLHGDKEHAKVICHDPMISGVITTVTIVGALLCMIKVCRKLSLRKGHKFYNICEIYMVFGNSTRYVPIKIGTSVGSPFDFYYNSFITPDKLTIEKKCLWDLIHVKWDGVHIEHDDQMVALRQHILIKPPLNWKLRSLLKTQCKVRYMAKQGTTWYNMSCKQENPALE